MAQKPVYPMDREHWFWLLPYCTMFADMEHTLICKRLFKKRMLIFRIRMLVHHGNKFMNFPSGLRICITLMRNRIQLFTLMRTRILLLIKVKRICDPLPRDLTVLLFFRLRAFTLTLTAPLHGSILSLYSS
jgi:hypothetical protein